MIYCNLTGLRSFAVDNTILDAALSALSMRCNLKYDDIQTVSNNLKCFFLVVRVKKVFS